MPSENNDRRQQVASETEDVLMEKITALFHLCDFNGKGYATREDLYRLKDELGLNDQEVDYAFDHLDTDKDENLTLEEFTAGFGLFLGLEQLPQKKIASVNADFAFQVFNLIDKQDKGYVTKQDLIAAADTLEISLQQVEKLYDLLNPETEKIYFEDFANNISTIVAFSSPLREIKSIEEEKIKRNGDRDVIARAFRMDLSEYDDEEIEALLHKQAALLFRQCDRENKNYVTQQDLRILSRELDLSEEFVSEAFVHLNTNNNGLLTLTEFVNGFQYFLGIERENGDCFNDDATFNDDFEMKKAEELFNLCDSDKKGYVTKYDLSRLTTELGMNDRQVVDIFNQLDDDRNGFISLEEFVQGFSKLFNDDGQKKRESNDLDEMYFSDSMQSSSENVLERGESISSNSSQHNFISRQMSIRYESGVNEIDEVLHNIEDDVGSAIPRDQMTRLWNTVSNSGDAMTTKMLEEFLKKVYSEIRTAKQETKHLEDVLERKSMVHSEEIKRIYDEMENQLQVEKVNLSNANRRRESSFREDLLKELSEKEKHIEKFMQRQSILENRLNEVREKEQLLKSQNNKLLKENNELEDRLNDSMSNLELLKTNLQHIEQKTSYEKKETLRAALHATQGMTHEHEGLLRRLETLKAMNQKLRDDRDTIEASLKSNMKLPSMSSPIEPSQTKPKVFRVGSNMDKYLVGSNSNASFTPGHKPLKKQGSVLSNYFDPLGDHVHEMLEDDENDFRNKRHSSNLGMIGETTEEFISPNHSFAELGSFVANDSVMETDEVESIDVLNSSNSTTWSPESQRQPPVGMNIEDETETSPTPSMLVPPENPSRVYKIVFVGDSGVGKSSFIYRFCFDDFRPNFSATIGVDFQVKTVKVRRQWVALQLWDTAGQERFRSITKQYFRRADGVVVMFDLTSETSFTNVKGWMLSVEDGAESDCCILLLGNKIDVASGENSQRRIKSEVAEKIAKDFNATYAEVSACSGEGVSEAIHKLARQMEKNEDSLLQHSILNLAMNKGEEKKKKKCC